MWIESIWSKEQPLTVTPDGPGEPVDAHLLVFEIPSRESSVEEVRRAYRGRISIELEGYMMGRKQGKMPRGICSVCRKDSALRADGTVFRHPDTYRHTEVCRGSTEKPSHVWDEKLETFIRWDIYAQGAEARKQAEAEDTAAAIGIGEGPMLLGCEYPVLNEHGRVVGRARIEVGHIRILGVKWMEKAS